MTTADAPLQPESDRPIAAPAAAVAVAPTAATSPHVPARLVRQGGSYGKIVLEVVLITLGVLLALLVDEWRERSEHRELAKASLGRFRTEFRANRDAVAAVLAKHEATLARMRAYFAADAAARATLPYPYAATNPAFMKYAAWDLAIATQALSYIEPELAETIAQVYTVQRQLDGATRDITLVMYSRAGDADPVPLTRSLGVYFGDCVLIEPRLIKLYDEALAKLDARLGTQ
jgi:hypothetical protein